MPQRSRAALREGIDALPVAFLDEQAHEIRVLTDYRDQLINERVRLASRLRWHLVQIAPRAGGTGAPARSDGPKIRANVARGIARLLRTPQARVAKAILKRINEIYREEGDLLAEINGLIQAQCPQLLAEPRAEQSRGNPMPQTTPRAPHRRLLYTTQTPAPP